MSAATGASGRCGKARGAGQSPIEDPDYERPENGPTTPLLHGVDLPPEVLRQVYHDNAARLLKTI